MSQYFSSYGVEKKDPCQSGRVSVACIRLRQDHAEKRNWQVEDVTLLYCHRGRAPAGFGPVL